MGERYVVRDKHTLKVLATYGDLAALYRDWFTRVGNHWEPKQPIIAVTQGSMADALYDLMTEDTEAAE